MSREETFEFFGKAAHFAALFLKGLKGVLSPDSLEGSFLFFRSFFGDVCFDKLLVHVGGHVAVILLLLPFTRLAFVFLFVADVVFAERDGVSPVNSAVLLRVALNLLDAVHSENFAHVLFSPVSGLVCLVVRPFCDGEATLFLRQSHEVIMQKVLRLLQHFAEESSATVGPVSLHVLDIRSCQSKHLRLLNALHAEVSSIFDSETVLEEAEVALSSRLVMHYCSYVYN